MYKNEFVLQIVLKVFTHSFRANRPSVCLRRYNFPIKTIKFAKKMLLPLNIPTVWRYMTYY